MKYLLILTLFFFSNLGSLGAQSVRMNLKKQPYETIFKGVKGVSIPYTFQFPELKNRINNDSLSLKEERYIRCTFYTEEGFPLESVPASLEQLISVTSDTPDVIDNIFFIPYSKLKFPEGRHKLYLVLESMHKGQSEIQLKSEKFYIQKPPVYTLTYTVNQIDVGGSDWDISNFFSAASVYPDLFWVINYADNRIYESDIHKNTFTLMGPESFEFRLSKGDAFYIAAWDDDTLIDDLAGYTLQTFDELQQIPSGVKKFDKILSWKYASALHNISEEDIKEGVLSITKNECQNGLQGISIHYDVSHFDMKEVSLFVKFPQLTASSSVSSIIKKLIPDYSLQKGLNLECGVGKKSIGSFFLPYSFLDLHGCMKGELVLELFSSGKEIVNKRISLSEINPKNQQFAHLIKVLENNQIDGIDGIQINWRRIPQGFNDEHCPISGGYDILSNVYILSNLDTLYTYQLKQRWNGSAKDENLFIPFSAFEYKEGQAELRCNIETFLLKDKMAFPMGENSLTNTFKLPKKLTISILHKESAFTKEAGINPRAFRLGIKSEKNFLWFTDWSSTETGIRSLTNQPALKSTETAFLDMVVEWEGGEQQFFPIGKVGTIENGVLTLKGEMLPAHFKKLKVILTLASK